MISLLIFNLIVFKCFDYEFYQKYITKLKYFDSNNWINLQFFLSLRLNQMLNK